MTEAPLLTVLVFAYRQEATIAAAVEAAFAQTYQPLEIILSDDCSPDGTFQIMQDLAARYVGPHRIVLNRNPQNLGMVGHINHIFPQAQGELVVVAEGDDVSHPDRVAKLHAAYQAQGRPAMIWSDVVDTDLEGVAKSRQRNDRAERHAAYAAMTLAEVAVEKNPCVGAACAWRPEIMSAFGPLTDPAAFPDKVFYFRARLLGSVGFCPDRLVRYRRGGGVSAAAGSDRKRLLHKAASLRQRRADCAAFAPDRADVLAALDRALAKTDRKLAALDA